MENKINVAEILRNCPKGMELDCTMYDDVEFMEVDTDRYDNIILRVGKKFIRRLNKYGTEDNIDYAKCVIFPKGKTTWEGFTPPCKFKDGDIVYIKATFDWVCIYKENKDTENFYQYVSMSPSSKSTYLVYDKVSFCKKDILKMRIATEEEKQKLFDAIKANGYRWDAETKTLKKLVEPRFKVGNKIVKKNSICVPILVTKVSDEFYYFNTESSVGVLSISEQDKYELVPDKFDVSTLIPFESRVLVRDTDHYEWEGAVFGRYDGNTFFTIGGNDWRYCIPYEGNEHLFGTTDECDDFYKINQ